MQRAFIATLVLAVAGFAGSAGAQTTIAADVVADTTWSGEIVLQKPIFVKSGATLTILPGTIVRGQPRTGPVVPGSTLGTPGALIVTQNGRIIANGNAVNPIIMTTAAVDNDDDGNPDDVSPADGFNDAWTPGDVFLDDTPKTAPLAPLNKAGIANVSLWGGLVILGNAPTNLGTGCGVGKGKCTIEGLTIPGFDPADATYGGLLAHDDSGSLRYVSVRHAGDEIGAANELNGISLGGVGDATVFEFIEVYANFDDGIEWFGGTVDGMNLHVAFVGDDVFDLDQGYTGVNQFLFGLMPFFNQNGGGPFGSASGDKAGEWDGDDALEVGGVSIDPADGTCRPFSYPKMYNLTVIGSTADDGAPGSPVDFTPVSAASANTGIQMRHGFAGELLNSIVINTGTSVPFDIDSGVGEGCPGFDTINNVGTCTAQVLASTFDDGAALGADELSALACGDADFRTALPLGANVQGGAFPGLANEDHTFNPTGNAAGKLDASLKTAPIDPKPNFGLIGTGGGATDGPDPVVYRGAFDRTAPGLWTDGWTVLSIAGLL